MGLREFLRTMRQRKARKRYEREKAQLERNRAGGGPEGFAERAKDSGAYGGGH
jgi:hypothetical protein